MSAGLINDCRLHFNFAVNFHSSPEEFAAASNAFSFSAAFSFVIAPLRISLPKLSAGVQNNTPSLWDDTMEQAYGRLREFGIEPIMELIQGVEQHEHTRYSKTGQCDPGHSV